MIQRAGAIDHDLALAQGERPGIEQAAGAELVPGARMARHHPEQRQRRGAAHDAVELRLDLRGIRRDERGDTRRGLGHQLSPLLQLS